MKALVLAGGQGKRLQSKLKDRPKPMAPVGDRPFLEYLILKLQKSKIQDIILYIGYLGNQIKDYFGDGNRWRVHIRYSEEYEALGTGGAIKLASSFIDNETFIAMNGDSFLDIDINVLVASHNRHRAIATIALAQVRETARFGKVEIDRTGEIVRFAEKKGSGPGLINAGIYVLNQQVLSQIPDGQVSLEHEVLPQLIGQRFFGVPAKGFFFDIGTPKYYSHFLHQQDILLSLLELY